MARLPSAAFVSAGGYHHHLGFKHVARARGVPPAAPPYVVGLALWNRVCSTRRTRVAEVRERRVEAAGEIAVEDRGSGFVVRDPWEIPAARDHRLISRAWRTVPESRSRRWATRWRAIAAETLRGGGAPAES